MTTFTLTTFAAGQVGTALAAIHTTPAATFDYVKALTLANTSASVTVTGSLYTRTGGVDRLLCDFSLAPREVLNGAGHLLAPGDSLRAVCSVAATLDFVIKGVREA